MLGTKRSGERKGDCGAEKKEAWELSSGCNGVILHKHLAFIKKAILQGPCSFNRGRFTFLCFHIGGLGFSSPGRERKMYVLEERLLSCL